MLIEIYNLDYLDNNYLDNIIPTKNIYINK